MVNRAPTPAARAPAATTPAGRGQTSSRFWDSRTSFPTQMLNPGPSLPPHPCQQDITLGSWSLVWPQIWATTHWLDGQRGPSAGGNHRSQSVAAAPAPKSIAPTLCKTKGLAGCISWVQLRQAGGEKDRGARPCTAHIPLGILLRSLWSTLTNEIRHEEGTGATSASNEAR